jgi:hypothetical protein
MIAQDLNRSNLLKVLGLFYLAEFMIHYLFIMLLKLKSFMTKAYRIFAPQIFLPTENVATKGTTRGNDHPACRRKTPPGLHPKLVPS